GWFFARAALRVMAHILELGGELSNFAVGPPLVTELARASRMLAAPGPEILGTWTFFPVNPFRFPKRLVPSRPPYAIHLYDHSWSSGHELSAVRRIVRTA